MQERLQAELKEVIETLRRQRVRQDDYRPVLDCVIVQAAALKRISPTGVLAETASQMVARARELQRILNVPKFVVEDLLDEAIGQLERAQRQASGNRTPIPTAGAEPPEAPLKLSVRRALAADKASRWLEP